MTPFVALLRGINVGGKNKVPMKDLAALFEQAGCEGVRTFIQSGNVVFRARAVEGLDGALARRIEEHFGFAVPVVLRTAAEMDGVLAGNPYLAAGADEDLLHVGFLAHQPSPEAVASLDPGRSPGDEFAVIGKEIYLRLPNGMGRTKLSNAWFDSRLRTVSTMRNWRTVSTLAGLVAGP